ncbi:hypothetical protein [Streptomyces sp. NBC_01361]|uniref:hypothetical protein n=1 Tax=Streptomyces sp. NBC_01361 TaxID=2903838 RepID=UPI002E37CA50|nr:hypothetical protein [Streptomyces sp. NBC_01361]
MQKRGERCAVGPGELRLVDLPLQHGQLMAQCQDFGVLVAVAHRREPYQSAWRYFDPAVVAGRLVESLQSFEEGSRESDVRQALMPPLDNPELAVILAGVVPLENTIQAVTCSDVVRSGGVVVFVDQALERAFDLGVLPCMP